MDISKPSTSSRFVSENSIKEAQDRRAEEWKKAYERLGQEAPPMPSTSTEKYDPRSLFEKLQEQKDAKQAAFEDKTSIRNQFRALDHDEIDFLDSVLDDSKIAEKERQAEIDAELAKFRDAVNTRVITDTPASSPPSATSPQLATTTTSAAPSTAATKPFPPKKKAGLQQKNLLAGAIKRKVSGSAAEKAEKIAKKPAIATKAVDPARKSTEVTSASSDVTKFDGPNDTIAPQSKRPRVDAATSPR